MRTLWFCNTRLSDADPSGSGTWLSATARALLDRGAVDIGIIAPGPVKQFTRCDYRQVKQWLVPDATRLGRDGLPANSLVQAIIAAAKEFSPDLIHTWGAELFWGLLTTRGLLPYPAVLEIQGLKSTCAKVFYGGLTFTEQLSLIGIKELLKRRTIHVERRDFARWGIYEQEIICGHRFIGVQTPWVAAHIAAINPAARRFSMDLVLREPFYSAKTWQVPSEPVLFCTAAYSFPFKGLHVAVRALGILRKRVPNARLRIAGCHQRSGIRQDGYIRWINELVRRLRLSDAIDWLGALNGAEIAQELCHAAAIVIPTFVENCCTAMQEAMAMGTPIVVSYVGGIPSLAKDNESCLFFPPGDEVMCAYQLERILTHRELSRRLSRESKKVALIRNDPDRVVQQQMEIYRQVLEASQATRRQPQSDILAFSSCR